MALGLLILTPIALIFYIPHNQIVSMYEGASKVAPVMIMILLLVVFSLWFQLILMLGYGHAKNKVYKSDVKNA